MQAKKSHLHFTVRPESASAADQSAEVAAGLAAHHRKPDPTSCSMSSTPTGTSPDSTSCPEAASRQHTDENTSAAISNNTLPNCPPSIPRHQQKPNQTSLPHMMQLCQEGRIETAASSLPHLLLQHHPLCARQCRGSGQRQDHREYTAPALLSAQHLQGGGAKS